LTGVVDVDQASLANLPVADEHVRHVIGVAANKVVGG